MNKKIIFSNTEPNLESWLLTPVPAQKYLPEWYKNIPKHCDKNAIGLQKYDSTVKSCVPFFDAVTAGYFILLNADVYVFMDDHGNHIFEWRTNQKIVDMHSTEQIGQFNVKEYDMQPFKWRNFYHIKTPSGYSTMFVHPLSMDDLPFHSFSGVVDTDNFTMEVNFPFLIKKDFEGFIERGTPIIQVIPFKRDSWSMEIGPTIKDLSSRSESYFSILKDPYKKLFWSKKSFK